MVVIGCAKRCAREHIPSIEGVEVYEIPEMLMFICVLLLMGILATRSLRLRALYGTLFMAAVGVITVMLAGTHLLVDVLPPAAIVLVVVVWLSDEFAIRYGVQPTSHLPDIHQYDK